MNAVGDMMVKRVKEPKTRGSTSIDVLDTRTYQALLDEAGRTGKSLRVTGNQIWEMFFLKRQYLHKTLPMIENLGVREGILFLYDDEKNISHIWFPVTLRLLSVHTKHSWMKQVERARV